MKSQKTINQIAGWGIFLISAFIYWSTMVPTVSLWDCGEFIACMAKMEVGHPPGAPVYLLLGRLLNIFALDASQIAYTANLLSVFASAATVMLLYFSAVIILKRVSGHVSDDKPLSWIIMVASGIGAMTFAVTDTFWFSAVEAEVYALSVFFTALCFWLFLKWEEAYQQKHSSVKWIILIAYLMGLSVGVHLLNLLIIPVLVLIILLRTEDFSWKILVKAMLIGGGILAFLLFGIIQNGLWLAGKFELLLVNRFGLPFNSGLLLFACLLFGLLFYVAFRTRKSNNWKHLLAVMSLVFMIGYSSYTMIIIRAGADTPINLNDPSDVFALDGFLNREQYAQNPLVYGHYYNTQTGELKYKDWYRKSNGAYETFKKADQYEYDAKGSGIFPRMHSNNPTHIYGYRQWAGANPDSKEKPSFITNLRFFFNYQINHMYVRYFMWNFSGRQNDEQGHGEMNKGNWISGIPLLDRSIEGDMLHSFSTESKARNVYFMLPLILGLIGLFFLINREKASKKYLAVTALLFLMTGPVIILYLNQTPFEPRERDYAFVGSFYAFALFIAYGVFAVGQYVYDKSQSKLTTVLSFVLLFLIVPFWMLIQNYDDHDRSNREFALKMAKSYLNSCEPNAILFTYGDNDTYPLWYVQEVEGYRTDVRVINYGLMGADWCIRQLKNAVNGAASIDLSIPQKRYKTGDLDYALLMDQSKEFAPLESVVQFIGSTKENSKLPLQNGTTVDYSPVNRFSLAYNSSDTLKWQCPKRVLYKNDIALLDILATNNWKRPVYFTIGADPEIFLGLKKNLEYQGLVYKLVANTQSVDQPILFDTETLLKYYLKKVDLGDGRSAYYDHYCRRNFDVIKYRQMGNVLASDLIEKDRLEDAKKVLEKSLYELPVQVAPEANGNLAMLHLAFEAGLKDEAEEGVGYLLYRHLNNLAWYASLSRRNQQAAAVTFQQEIEKSELFRMVLDTIGNDNLTQQFKDAYGQLGLEM